MSLIKYSSNEIKQMLGKTNYTPELCISLMEFMSEGFSIEAFCGKCLITVTTLKAWAKKYRELEDAINIGRNLQRYQWETILVEQSKGIIKANPAAMIFALKNFFPEDFQDKREVAITASQIVIDTGIGHRDNNHIEEAVIVDEIQEAINFDDIELEEEEANMGFSQSIDSMFVDEDIDCL